MCVIAYADERRITKEEFENCFKANSDGFGMAWRKDGKVMYQKGFMKLEDAWGFYSKNKCALRHVLHFRKKSIGELSQELTHPFLVSKKSQIRLSGSTSNSVFFQNGTIKEWEDHFISYCIAIGETPTGLLSDTRALSMIISRTGRDILSHFPGRFVDFTPDMTYLFGDYEKVADAKEKEVWFSNKSYETKVVVSATTRSMCGKDYHGYSGYKETKTDTTKETSTKLIGNSKDKVLHWYDLSNYKI